MKNDRRKPLQVAKGVLRYLSETKQTRLLADVTRQLTRKATEPAREKKIVAASVVPCTRKQLAEMQRIVKTALGLELPIVNTIDRRLIGGFTIRVGDWHLDASLSYELGSIRRILTS